MGARIASFVFALGILGLFALDHNPKQRTSKALWIPALWVFIAASRSASQWLSSLGSGGAVPSLESTDQFLEGSPIDRFILTGLLVVGLIALVRRGTKVLTLLGANVPICLFFFYCGVSILWSDFPDVAFKRWTKALGDLVMVLLVLTDLDPSAAVKRLLSRVGFVLVPLSVLFIKYYPDLGRGYRPWIWTPYYTGVTTNKNELGYLCLVFGLGTLWRFLEAWRDRHSRVRRLIAHGVVLAMVLWLFWMANSMTSFSCFLMASVLMAQSNFRVLAGRAWVVHVLVGAILAVSVSTLFLDLGSGLLETMGRDPTLTGRTEIWHRVFGMMNNPLFGTGFSSFWLGKRLETMWSLYWWHPREAHDGYVEVYLNLGWVGVVLLTGVLVTGYRNAIAAFHRDLETGRLRVAYFVVAVAYNFTESAFGTMNLVWIFCLLAIVAVPGGWVRIKPRKAVAALAPTVSNPLVYQRFNEV
jgi:O-antigen ligase